MHVNHDYNAGLAPSFHKPAGSQVQTFPPNEHDLIKTQSGIVARLGGVATDPQRNAAGVIEQITCPMSVDVYA